MNDSTHTPLDMDTEQLHTTGYTATPKPRSMLHLYHLWGGDRRARHASLTRLSGDIHEEKSEANEGVPPTSPLGPVDGNSGTEQDVLFQRWQQYIREWNANAARQAIRPRRSSPSNTEWHNRDRTLFQFSDSDDQASQGDNCSSSEDISTDSSGAHTSDREFLVESDSDCTCQDNNSLGSSRNREDKLCTSSSSEDTDCFTPRRPSYVQSTRTRRNTLRRRLDSPPSENSPDSHRGSDAPQINPHTLFSGSNPCEHN